MAEARISALETVRKAIAEGDVDFLREGVPVLAQAVKEAEVAELAGVPKGERLAQELAAIAELQQAHGPEALVAALERALTFRRYGFAHPLDPPCRIGHASRPIGR